MKYKLEYIKSNNIQYTYSNIGHFILNMFKWEPPTPPTSKTRTKARRGYMLHVWRWWSLKEEIPTKEIFNQLIKITDVIKAHSVRRSSSIIGLAVHAVRYLHEPFRANFDPSPRSSELIWDTELKLYTCNYVIHIEESTKFQ